MATDRAEHTDQSRTRLNAVALCCPVLKDGIPCIQ